MPLMTTARTREELDAYARDICDNPKCKVKHDIAFMCDNHVDAPTFVAYKQGSGVLEIYCAVCHELVAELELASRELVLTA